MASLLTRTTGWEPDAQPGRTPRYDHVAYLCAPPHCPSSAEPPPRRRADALAGRDRGPRPSGRSAAVIVFLLLFWRPVIRWAIRLTRWGIAAVLMTAAATVTVITVTAVTTAWLRGWPPARLRRAAAWSLSMTAVYLTVRAVTARCLEAALAGPYLDWRAGWHAFGFGDTLAAFVLCAFTPAM